MVNDTSSVHPQPTHLITSTNHGGYITIVAALMIVWTTLFYIIRVIVRLAFNGLIATDDIVATAGTVFGIAQSVIAITAVGAGIGKHASSLSEDALSKTGMSVYAADLIFIITICLAKISTSELVARLTRKRQHLLVCRIASALVAVWGVASILTIGVGCHPSHPWDVVDRCSNLSTSWVAIGLVDVILELVLLALPVYLVWPLQMPFKTKFVVISAFSFRLPIIPIVILRLLAFNSIDHSSDYTWDVVLAIVYAQVEMHFSLIAATIPCLRPFLNALNTGYLATEVGQVDRSIVELGNTSSQGLHSKSTYNDPNSSRTSNRNSFRSSYKAKPSPDISTRSTRAHTLDDIERSTSPPPLPRNWKSPEELPALDHSSVPTITSIRHPRQWRQPEELPKLDHATFSRASSTRNGVDRSTSSQSLDRLVIHKTIGYDVRFSKQ